MAKNASPRKKRLLNINELPPENAESGIRISSRAQSNGLVIRPFRFLEHYGDQNSDQLKKYITYKGPVLRKGTRWWIEYQYRVPEDIRQNYGNRTWEKFRVFEDINRHKSDEYANLLLAAVKQNLENGYNPFQDERRAFVKARTDAKAPANKKWTIIQGLSYFLQQWEHRGNEPDTIRNYKRAVGHLVEWLTTRKMQNDPAGALQKKWIELALQEAGQVHKWSNRTYNNNLTFLRTALKFMTDEGILAKNPVTGISKKRSKSKKHRYYEPETFALVRKVMKEHDPLLFFASSLVYYLCIRSQKELKSLKVGNIFLDRKQVLIRAEDAKTDADRFIPIPDELLPELKELKKSYPPEYYVIGAAHKNKFIRYNVPCPTPFGKNFLVKRFAKIRRLAKLDDAYSLYGFKHTRIIHLKQDGGQDGDIMRLTGHTSYEAYSAYLRDLGVDGNPEAINKISRKF